MPKVKSKKLLKRKPGSEDESRKKEERQIETMGLKENEDEELKELEKRLFGNAADTFEHDSDVSDEESISTVKEANITEEEGPTTEPTRKPAWTDETDDITFHDAVEEQGRKCHPGVNGAKDYKQIVKQKYQSVMGVPKWADRTKMSKDEDNLLSKSGSFVKKSTALEKGTLKLKKLKDLNTETYTEGPIIKVIKFHPKATVAMVAGVSGVVSLFQVDGKQNLKLQSIQYKRFPVSCGSFLNNGEEFIVGSQHFRYFYSHNLMTGQSVKVNNSKIIDVTNMKNFKVSPDEKIIAACGKYGNIYLLSATSKEYIGTLKMNGNVNAIDFNENGSKMFSHGSDGQVYVWDMKTRDCVYKYFDDGCLNGTSIAASSNDQFVACGSSSGVVNIYEANKMHGSTCQPFKIVDNLVTQVNCVKFNASCEILSMSSDYKFNAIKLLHCPSMTVFSNFPSFQSKFNRPQCVDFSPNSGYFAVGDNKGSAHLFRLKYYGNY